MLEVGRALLLQPRLLLDRRAIDRASLHSGQSGLRLDAGLVETRDNGAHDRAEREEGARGERLRNRPPTGRTILSGPAARSSTILRSGTSSSVAWWPSTSRLDRAMRRVAESRARIRLWRRWHKRVLALKGLDSATALTRGIGGESDDIDHGRNRAEVGRATVAHGRVLRRGARFGGGSAGCNRRVPDVAHIGFSIAEPLDIYLEGVPIWADRLGANVVGTKRIPASETFQDRVGAFVEMAQVWVGYRGRAL